MNFIDFDLSNDDGLLFSKTGQVDFEIEIWDAEYVVSQRLTYKDALTIYKWLKEALGQ